MLAIAHACAVIGIDGTIVEVQVDFNPRAALPSFTIVGLADSAVRESRERVKASIKNSGLRYPNKAYIVNLSPANLPKHSTAYDLAIAVGVLASTDQIPLHALENALFIGELSLDGRVRHVKGVLPMAFSASLNGYKTIYVSKDDAEQAALVEGVDVIPIETLGQLVEHLYQLNPIAPCASTELHLNSNSVQDNYPDFESIKGQEHLKRALEIAASGSHNIRMVGPPGTGKSLSAKALVSILPSMTFEEAIEVTRVYSVADALSEDESLVRHRPFQSPHHTISSAGLIGGGTIPKPGAVSLSHRGILFLDEANEFPIRILELMRQPIEDKIVNISRAKGTVSFPANFMLVLAHNPCPCGYFGDNSRVCTCTPNQISRYQSKLSGPLLDRIDIHIEVPRVDYDKLMEDRRGESSIDIRKRVENARLIQRERFKDYPHIFSNGDMGAGEVEEFCNLNEEAKQVLLLSIKKLQLSARGYHRVLKLSRTIADLDNSDDIQVRHVAEALQYRAKQSL